MIGNNIIHFDSFGVEHIPKNIKKIIGSKNKITNIEYKHTIRHFVDNFVLDLYSLLDYTNLFSSNDYEKNDEIILKLFQ